MIDLIWRGLLKLISIILFAIGALIALVIFLVVLIVALLLSIPTLLLLGIYFTVKYLWWKATQKEDHPPEFSH